MSFVEIQRIALPSAVRLARTYILRWECATLALVALAVVYCRGNILLNKPRKVLNPKTFQEVVLSQKTAVSYNITIYRFSLPRSTDILGLPIGQHISLAAQVPGRPKEIVRSYTPISFDTESGYFDILVKAYPQGVMSSYLVTLPIGATMKVRGPKGAMVYTPNMCRHIGMIAGGTGITPMLQIIKSILRNRPRNGGNDITKIDLIFANSRLEDIILKDELDQMATANEGFNIYYVLSSPPSNWTGGVGHVTANMVKLRFPVPANDTKVLLCGPSSMVASMKNVALSLGYQSPRPLSKLEDQVFSF
ncbi:hypothetical protein V1525DRAFT_414480 [Lipomyces kononenkoae]|uniref:Uncharacterized protein n=1 Tax=Lipomyces kononenkoae TaxID=34357 RepID=A0ACC3SSC9_LIPKO